MPNFAKIESKDNAKIKYAVNLQNSAKFRRSEGAFVIEGLRLCCDAALNGYTPKTLFFTGQAYERHTAQVEQLAASAQSAYVVSEPVFSKLADTTQPQGVLCIYAMPQWPSLGALKPGGRYIGLENLADPSNLGAVARTAEAFGLDGIILYGGNGCDPFAPKVQRAAMGALLRLPVFRMQSQAEFEMVQRRFSMYAAVVQGGTPLQQVRLQAPCVVWVGNEANGLSEETRARCNAQVTIPMSGRAESLNAAAAAAVLIWEMAKQV